MSECIDKDTIEKTQFALDNKDSYVSVVVDDLLIFDACKHIKDLEDKIEKSNQLLQAHRTKDFSINGIFTGEECPNCYRDMLKDNGDCFHCHICSGDFPYSIKDQNQT